VPTTAGATSEPLGKRLFKTRLELIAALEAEVKGDRAAEPRAIGYGTLRGETAEVLRSEVSAMNLDNFVVRPRRQLVERYATEAAWKSLDDNAYDELAHQVAGLPSELDPEDEEAKRFDLLMLRLQLAVLRSEPGFERLRDHVREIANRLEEKASIPMVNDALALILDVQSDEWWQDVTVPMLENVRKRLRLLVRLIDKRNRAPIYTDFEDEIGAERAIDLPGFERPEDFERFRAKARQFLKAHEDHVTIHKLRFNHALTLSDLAELERILMESGIGSPADVERAKRDGEGLGLFVRSLVGLDREAAKSAVGRFLDGKTLTANQIEFVSLIVDHLTEHGSIAIDSLYESPYTDFSPRGVDGVFPSDQVDQLIHVLAEVRSRAVA